MLTFTTHLQPVDQLFLDGVLSCSVRGHAEPLGCLSEPLLLVLILWVGSCPLGAHKHTHMTMARAYNMYGNNSYQSSAVKV